jgi:hypothetical protein
VPDLLCGLTWLGAWIPRMKNDFMASVWLCLPNLLRAPLAGLR